MRVLEKWKLGKQRGCIGVNRYSTNGYSVFYWSSEVLRKCNDGFAISNQGWKTPMTVRVLNAILDFCGSEWDVHIVRGVMCLSYKDQLFVFPDKTWVEFDNAGNCQSKLCCYSKKDQPLKIINKFFKELVAFLNLGGDPSLIKIPIYSKEIPFSEFYENYVAPMRMIYFHSSFERTWQNFNSWVCEDIKRALKRLYARNVLNIEKLKIGGNHEEDNRVSGKETA
ncbi:MAG: hypothetical protein QXG39_02785 [Candidatus Aenigmatarchaeota archaeon]